MRQASTTSRRANYMLLAIGLAAQTTPSTSLLSTSAITTRSSPSGMIIWPRPMERAPITLLALLSIAVRARRSSSAMKAILITPPVLRLSSQQPTLVEFCSTTSSAETFLA
ncbi:hypothetical protein BTJ68_12273 [Hortaea werneckii EXF-2000]|uniref:Uncharacterized protein n=1 Tax=Hortaea werneckii EXF-2000 TaxID=1157616 RepID=A0A1Z5SUD8_HORWE|nr:hypothetical protein BTJ68_12273 [Hortaea werneckii EXF-2000]